ILDLGVGNTEAGSDNGRTEESIFFLGGNAGAEVDVVVTEDGASKLRVRVGIFERETTAGQDAGGTYLLEAACRNIHGVRPGRGNEFTVFVADVRDLEAVLAILPAERETVLIGNPLFVDLRVV